MARVKKNVVVAMVAGTADNAPAAAQNGSSPVIKKTACPIARAGFRAGARPVTVTINGATLQAEVKEFSTGSFGWYLNGKTTIDVDGTLVTVQAGMNLIVVGSKDRSR
jgi:hypothetical protein